MKQLVINYKKANQILSIIAENSPVAKSWIKGDIGDTPEILERLGYISIDKTVLSMTEYKITPDGMKFYVNGGFKTENIEKDSVGIASNSNKYCLIKNINWRNAIDIIALVASIITILSFIF